MKYMLDTNICIFLIKHKPENVLKKFMEHDPSDFCISAITYAELVYGVENSAAREKNMLALTIFLSEIRIMEFGDMAAIEYGRLRSDLKRKGTPIGVMDMMIAAHAKALNLTIVTNNVREFLRVEGLRVEDWVP